MIVKNSTASYAVPVKNTEKRLGSVVKSMRQAIGMTQEKLAQQLTAEGYPTRQNTVAKLEGGLRPTSVGELGALARIFNYSVSELAEAVFSEDADEDEAAKGALLSELAALESRISELRSALAMYMSSVAETQYQLRECEGRAALLRSSLGRRDRTQEPGGGQLGEHPEEA